VDVTRVSDWSDAAVEATVTLWRPTGLQELALVEASGWRAWPPRLPDQPIFYPVLDEEYARMIAERWNVPASGAGYVTRFRLRRAFLDGYEVHQVGGRTILEYWIPAEDLDELNANIVGQIEVVAEYVSTYGEGGVTRTVTAPATPLEPFVRGRLAAAPS
jgi:hypothetical protein